MYKKDILLRGITDNGYYYFIDYSHPLTIGNSGKVLYHRHIASINSGRWLNSSEHVHHIDGNKLNNNKNNLNICSNSEHISLHNKSLKDIACLTCSKLFTPSNSRSKYCSDSCYHVSLIKDKSITKETLDKVIPYLPWKVIGYIFGYTDNGIRKRAISLGCDITKAKNAHKKTKSRSSEVEQ